ncbi:sporulation initiation factor Spo0A C-terminal domain-containing protein [Ruminococcus flavefaciens]|uniref:sporulation initiation factor Spo0A C-terminal domain-containing protein n=1 Tax=Ruminococcus flavefaciens TaxID=1265 RepID=UPI00048A8094|nr:sporulation initiation factor Spo0A C-terminal domain-containing protein [Ruminococcus flavefaciens]
MGNRLLICDSSPAVGRLIALRLRNMGIASECCRPSLQAIAKRYDPAVHKAVLLFTYRADERLLKFIRQAADNGSTVFAGLYSPSAALGKSIKNAGAAVTFLMPCPPEEICSRILLRLETANSTAERIELILAEAGFPRNLSGFYYLAKAAELCTADPARIWGGMGGIYEETAVAFSTSPSLVERSIRNLSAHIAENGALMRLTNGMLCEKLTNTELICAVCDIFSRL